MAMFDNQRVDPIKGLLFRGAWSFVLQLDPAGTIRLEASGILPSIHRKSRRKLTSTPTVSMPKSGHHLLKSGLKTRNYHWGNLR